MMGLRVALRELYTQHKDVLQLFEEQQKHVGVERQHDSRSWGRGLLTESTTGRETELQELGDEMAEVRKDLVMSTSSSGKTTKRFGEQREKKSGHLGAAALERERLMLVTIAHKEAEVQEGKA